MDDMDIGAAFMLLWIFFWSAFAFIAFVIVVSILQAIFEHFVKINNGDKEKKKDE